MDTPNHHLTFGVSVWYIYLHEWLILMVNVGIGKYTVRPMDGMGFRIHRWPGSLCIGALPLQRSGLSRGVPARNRWTSNPFPPEWYFCGIQSHPKSGYLRILPWILRVS